MPIIAKLSREFYERFGDKVVNEMVDLFNSIDEASRSDLERLNEANALRFEARLDHLESSVAGLDKRVSDFPAVLEKALHTQTRWMIGAWGVLLASQIALWLR